MPPAVKALFFDVFGTLVDWRTSIAREAQSLLEARGHKLDWSAFADAWRGEYQGAMEEVRVGRIGFRKLDLLHRRNLDRIPPAPVRNVRCQIERQRHRRGQTEPPRDDSKAIDREAAGCDLLRDACRRGDEKSQSGRYAHERAELAIGDVQHAVRKEVQKHQSENRARDLDGDEQRQSKTHIGQRRSPEAYRRQRLALDGDHDAEDHGGRNQLVRNIYQRPAAVLRHPGRFEE